MIGEGINGGYVAMRLPEDRQALPPLRGQELSPNDFFVGTTQLDRHINSGGTAAVYGGRQVTESGQQPVAVKVEHQTTDIPLSHEIAVYQALPDSPHILRQIDHGTGWRRGRSDRRYMEMELARGSVGDELKKYGALEPVKAVGYLTDILSGIVIVHRAGFVHNDVKPDNLLIVGDKVKLADMGIARPSGDRPEPVRRELDLPIATGTYIGTPLYGAPEQARGKVDPMTDIHAVGLTAAEMLIGKPVFNRGDTARQQLRKVVNEDSHDAAINRAMLELIQRGRGVFEQPIRDATQTDIDKRPDALTLSEDIDARLQELLEEEEGRRKEKKIFVAK